jgi:predicted kinase
VPQLVFINGAPGSGKSTLARRLVDTRPLSLLLDVDTLRGQLGDWRRDPGAAGLAARRIALAMARTHLSVGADVVVPQFVYRPDLIDQLRQVAAEIDAEFVLVVLVSSPEEAASRFASRATSSEQNHRDAAALQQAPGARPLERLYEGMMKMLAAYDDVRHVSSVPGDIDGTYGRLLQVLSVPTGSASG